MSAESVGFIMLLKKCLKSKTLMVGEAQGYFFNGKVVGLDEMGLKWHPEMYLNYGIDSDTW